MNVLVRNDSPVLTSGAIGVVALVILLAFGTVFSPPVERFGPVILSAFAATVSLAAWAHQAHKRWTLSGYLTRFASCAAVWNLIGFVWARL